MTWLSDLLSKCYLSLFRPFYEFLYDGSSRFFWLYCATGLVLAAWVHTHRHTGRPFGDVFFDRETWLGRSALNDYFILFTGFLLRVTILSWAYVSWQPTAGFVTGLFKSMGVTGTGLDGSSVLVAVALTATLFLVDDFLRYTVHLAMHRVPELWEIHKVHHSAEKLNFATAERFHPVETILTTAGLTVGMGVVNGIFFAFFGDQLTPLTVFGANAGLVVFNLAGGVLRHAPVWVASAPPSSTGSSAPPCTRSITRTIRSTTTATSAESLSCWDRWFGTISTRSRRKEMTGYGMAKRPRLSVRSRCSTSADHPMPRGFRPPHQSNRPGSGLVQQYQSCGLIRPKQSRPTVRPIGQPGRWGELFLCRIKSHATRVVRRRGGFNFRTVIDMVPANSTSTADKRSPWARRGHAGG